MKKIKDLIITDNKRFFKNDGNIYHGMRSTDAGYNKFGEIYESSRTFAKAKCRCFETHAAHTGTGTRDMDFSID